MVGKVLVLLGSDKDWLANNIKAVGLVDVAQVYRNITKIQKRLRTLYYHTSLNKTCWYGEWKNYIQEYDTIILFDAFLATDVAEYIEAKAPNSRLIVFYYNPWENNYHISDKARQNCEIWSFDKDDCKKYNLNYNHQFYFYNLRNQETDEKYQNDIFFVGKDKGRLPLLMDIYKRLAGCDIKSNIYVVKDRKAYRGYQAQFVKTENLSYTEVLKYIYNSKCLLEVVQEGQEGLTLRSVEAMFFNKKLITNNLSIDKYSFYNPDLIYIWGKDKRDLKKFIETTGVCWEQETVDRYSFEHWLSNFNISCIKE